MRRLALPILLVVCLVPVARAAVPDYTGPYTQSGSSCGAGIDPITMVWRGPDAYAQNVSGQVHYHTGGYWDNTSGSSQWLWVKDQNNNNSCREMNFQRASGAYTRIHVRMWYIPLSCCDNKKTTGDPHHEDWKISCGHAVDQNGSNGSGFDVGRQTIRNNFASGGHYVDTEYWGNTQNFEQCDGGWAGSNGYGALISVYHEQG